MWCRSYMMWCDAIEELYDVKRWRSYMMWCDVGAIWCDVMEEQYDVMWCRCRSYMIWCDGHMMYLSRIAMSVVHEVHRGNGVEVVRQREGKQGRQPQQQDHLEAFLRDGLVDGSPFAVSWWGGGQHHRYSKLPHHEHIEIIVSGWWFIRNIIIHYS